MSKRGEFRQFHVNFWQSADVEDLDPIEKLLYVYLITSPKSNMEGVYKTTMRRIAFETGIDKDMIPKMSARFEEKGIGGVYQLEDSTWVVVSHAPQFMNKSPNVQTYFNDNISELPDCVIQFMDSVGYKWPDWYDGKPLGSPYQAPTQGLHSPSPYPGATQGQHDTDTDTDTDTKTKTDTETDQRADSSAAGSEVHQLYLQLFAKPIPPGDYQTAALLAKRFPLDVIRYELEKAADKGNPIKYIHSYMAKPGYEPPAAEIKESKRKQKREEFPEEEDGAVDPDVLEMIRRKYYSEAQGEDSEKSQSEGVSIW